jgi:tRNA (guanine-N7-)-methyltransferase
MRYRGRFAPSPTGPLHAGSLVAALASWLDAKAHRGTWLVRIEDVDGPRCSVEAAQTQLAQLQACHLFSDEPVTWQSQRTSHYQAALTRLREQHAVYACCCSRADISKVLLALGVATERHRDMPYPGSCRGLSLPYQTGLSVRFKVQPGMQSWRDRRLGDQAQNLVTAVGDFVLQRSDGLWAYQLAVVVDDAAQGITHVVRGEDLADNTPRQIQLQQALGFPTPVYLHTPLVLATDGEKLSKQNGALSVNVSTPELALAALQSAASHLQLPIQAADTCAQALAQWVQPWRERWGMSRHDWLPQAQSVSLCEPFDMNSPAPAHVAHPKTIKSFVTRAGRTTSGQAKALAELGPRFVLPFQKKLLSAQEAFGRAGGLILEIGFGMGDATAQIAAVRPDDNFLCCEVHEPGVGALLKRMGEAGIDNIRILQHDAVDVIEHMLDANSLDGVHVFFPDPWHKLRHHKRRLIQTPFVQQLVQRIKPGGYVHCATDWEPYAHHILQVFQAEPLLRNRSQRADGFADQPVYRPLTKFENRGLKLGHGVWDVVFHRV